MNVADTPPDDLAALITAINDLLPATGMTYDDLEIDSVAYETGIPEASILALLRGETVPDETLNPGFTDRLAFLLETRRAPDGNPHKKVAIADALGVSRGMVSSLFSGNRDAGRGTSAALEEFFDVDPGFLSTSGRRALTRALRPVYASLLTLSTLHGRQVSHMALRSGAAGADIRLAAQLQKALSAVLTQHEPEPPTDPQEQELRDITDQVRALAPTSRTRLMDKIRGLLGQS
ncbi:helix-turn-helix domain-containing protein [Streptomyces sp. NPDC014746]|uniref:helix-turn-helix domain-containing protein n=1 Tax=Streptomyces sp. NPDC014746 TaxID=3364904 RepID=UPI0036F4E4AD